ncbi:hypothetical protein [Psychrobacter sp. TWR1-1-1]|uniref:hypothetical protein n=1 Tax=Psychrobacter sp. TWR1-1-1 TaxID=2804665 RepID=UPI003CEABC8B
MNNELKGSDLTRAMLARGDKKVWCAVCDDSDEQAMMDHCGNDFTAYIVTDIFIVMLACRGSLPCPLR